MCPVLLVRSLFENSGIRMSEANSISNLFITANGPPKAASRMVIANWDVQFFGIVA